MELKGKILPPYMIPGTSKGIIQFEVEDLETVLRDIPGMYEKTLRIIAKQWRDKRTLNMNSYYWVLASKLALALHTTPEEIHVKTIEDHSIPWVDDEGGLFEITVKSGCDPHICGMYWKQRAVSHDGKWTAWYRIKGTSDCTKEEMSLFLDDLIEDCKEQGIETATPDELERIKALDI